MLLPRCQVFFEKFFNIPLKYYIFFKPKLLKHGARAARARNVHKVLGGHAVSAIAAYAARTKKEAHLTH